MSILPPKMTIFSLDRPRQLLDKNIMRRYCLHRLLNATSGHSVVLDTALLKGWLDKIWFVYVFGFKGILFSLTM